MRRRQVIAGLVAAATASFLPHSTRRLGNPLAVSGDDYDSQGDWVDIDPPMSDPINDHENRLVSAPVPSPQLTKPADVSVQPSSHANTDEEVVSNHKAVAAKPPLINKNIDFARDYDDDIFISISDAPLLHSVNLRLKNLQNTVGYGHFNILSFDDALKFGRRFSDVGQFTPDELAFIEKVFSYNAADYGFYGEKVTDSLSTAIKKQQTFKVPHTGHYLFKDQSFAYYEKIRKSVGEGIILTSGIRSNVKQLHLFLAKVIRVNGNLSRASRSLAPPGYSYHGIGDFDVGRKGWGGKNFTDAFSQTDEFKRMQDLGYIAIRYDEGNQLGVRFEPWHIQVV